MGDTRGDPSTPWRLPSQAQHCVSCWTGRGIQLTLWREDVFADPCPSRILSLSLAQNTHDHLECFSGPHLIFERYLRDEGWRQSSHVCGSAGGWNRGFQTHPGTSGAAECPSLALCFTSLQLGAHSHFPVCGEPFPPLHQAYPKAPPFVLGSQGPLRLRWLR